MRRFDLGMSLGYLSEWTVVEAVREIFQNAIDAETMCSQNGMFYSYEDGVLRIGNKLCGLNTKSLLLGESAKRDSKDTIGQYGEGYKVATVVLLRLGKTLTIQNPGYREIWTARVIRSRRYGVDVAVFDVEKASVFKTDIGSDLVFEIGGITSEEWEQIVTSNLHLQELKKEDYIQAGKSRILLNPEMSGKLFVGGLFVSRSKRATLGYDLEPSLLKLDRDRTLVDNFDLQFALSRVLCRVKDVDFLEDIKNEWDGEYLLHFLSDDRVTSELCEREFDSFHEKYGEDAIPCSDMDEFNRLSSNGFNAVMVTHNQMSYICADPRYDWNREETLRPDGDLADALESWFNEYIAEDSEAHKTGKSIVAEVVSRLKP